MYKENIMDVNEARIESLANFLNIEKNQINRTNVPTQFKSDKGYIVLTKEEAKQDWFSFTKKLNCLMTNDLFSIYVF